ncbi:hypothetical protein N9B91_01650 [Gammaproteobacteria bacterium]|jgi:hypothetical protein|nr:hypothetical protein [Gammaproteobacteria bacterium]
MVNEYFTLHSYGGTLEYYLFELANFSVLALFALLVYKLSYINSNSLLVWLVIFFTPLVINYFVISPGMFGDQFEYAGEVMSLKATGTSIENISLYRYSTINPITLTAKILGVTPLPNYMTVTSLAFANKFFLFVTFLWFKRFFSNENEVLLYFLIPSLILYSSMSLRDTLIIVISILFIINLIRDRYVFALVLLPPLYILKLQMFSFLLLYLVARLFFRAHKNYYLFLLFIFGVMIGGFIMEEQLLEVLNLYRLAFAAEDFVGLDGSISYKAFNVYGAGLAEALELSSFADAIFKAILNLPIFFIMPLPWNWTNIFYPVQAFESWVLIYLYVRLGMKENLYKNPEFILLTFILMVGSSIYALFMFNEGTFVRYRFSLYYPFLLAAFYLSNKSYKLAKKEY